MTTPVRDVVRDELRSVQRENRKLKFEIRLGQLVADGYKRRPSPTDAAFFAGEACEICTHVGLGIHCFHKRRNGSIISTVGLYHCPVCMHWGEF